MKKLTVSSYVKVKYKYWIQILLIAQKTGGGGVNIKIKFRKEKEGETKENEENITVKEVDLGDGTRKMLKFERRDEMSTEAVIKDQSQQVTTEVNKELPTQIKEEDRSVPPAPPTALPNVDKQLSKLEVEISKNRDMIKSLENKIENLNKDLDDLVSLYEIVSEQMNPFVGLSKVTKQRLEALEKFTEEFENIKNRLEDLEAFVGKMPYEKNKENLAEIASQITNLEELDNIVERAISTFIVEENMDSLIDRLLEEIKNE